MANNAYIGLLKRDTHAALLSTGSVEPGRAKMLPHQSEQDRDRNLQRAGRDENCWEPEPQYWLVRRVDHVRRGGGEVAEHLGFVQRPEMSFA